jgi:hypothetical protein
VVVFPIVAATLALACAVTLLADYLRRPRPDKFVWVMAFAMFWLAAAAKVLADLSGWTPLLARAYYVFGATLVVGYLALGELYLLLPRRWADRAAGLVAALTALSVALVWRAPVASDITEQGWEALERGPALTALTLGFNALGTLILIGGCLYSVVRMRRVRAVRRRTLGLALIAGGTLVVASGGTLTRFGSEQYFYIAMALGVGLIFAGYLRARGPGVSRPRRRARWTLRRDYRGVAWCGRRPAARPYRRRAAGLRAAGSQAARPAAAQTRRSLPHSGPGPSG